MVDCSCGSQPDTSYPETDTVSGIDDTSGQICPKCFGFWLFVLLLLLILLRRRN